VWMRSPAHLYSRSASTSGGSKHCARSTWLRTSRTETTLPPLGDIRPVPEMNPTRTNSGRRPHRFREGRVCAHPVIDGRSSHTYATSYLHGRDKLVDVELSTHGLDRIGGMPRKSESCASEDPWSDTTDRSGRRRIRNFVSTQVRPDRTSQIADRHDRPMRKVDSD
jgi:hypothetical protein